MACYCRGLLHARPSYLGDVPGHDFGAPLVNRRAVSRGRYEYTRAVSAAALLGTRISSLQPESSPALGAAGGTFALSDGFGLPQSLSVATSSDTVYQGVSGFSVLAAGTFVDTDGAIESDGSLLATRIALEDPLAVQVEIGRCYTPRLPSLLLCFGDNSSEALAWM